MSLVSLLLFVSVSTPTWAQDAKSIFETGLGNFKAIQTQADLTSLFPEEWEAIAFSGQETSVALDDVYGMVRTYGTDKIQSVWAHYAGVRYRLSVSTIDDYFMQIQFTLDTPEPGPMIRGLVVNEPPEDQVVWECKWVHPILLACHHQGHENYAVYLGRRRYEAFESAFGANSPVMIELRQLLNRIN